MAEPWIDISDLPVGMADLEQQADGLPNDQLFIRRPGDRPDAGPAQRLERGEPGWLARGLASDQPFHIHAINLQRTSPPYARLLARFLDRIEPLLGTGRANLREAGIGYFLSNRHGVVPFHADREHNFLIQVFGEKHMHIFPAGDGEIFPPPARERLAARGLHLLDTYRPEFEPRGRVLSLRPGMSTYQPPLWPHWVVGGEVPSLAIYFSIITRDVVREQLIYKLNHRLRRIGLRPDLVGRHPVSDSVKSRTAAVLYAGWQLVKKIRA